MWQVFYGPDLIYDPRDPELALVGMAGKNTLNQTGSFEFSMPPAHPFAGTLNLLQKDVEIIVRQDGKTRFIGRLMPAEQEFFSMTKYFAEGERGYLNDVVLPVYTTGINGVPSTVDGLFNWYISEYNARVSPKHRFIVGKNEGYLLDANNYVFRESSQRPTVWAEIREKLLEKLGGFIRARHEGDIRYIDYLADGGLASAQRIEFGRNLTDYIRRVDPTDFCTVVIPLGKEVEDEEGNAGDKLDISALSDGNIQEGFIKRGDRIISVEGVEKYGEIEQTVHFDDVTTPEYLLQAGLRNLINRRFGDTLEIKAVDLHALDPDVQPFEYGDYIRVTSKPHGVDEYFMCVETSLSPGDPAAESLVLGNTYDTLTGKQSARIAALNSSINKTYEALAPIDAAAKAAAKDAIAAKQTAEAAQEQAESKSKNWTAQPVPLYSKDDTWAQGADGDILVCLHSKASGEVFDPTDWVASSKHTDDAKATEAKDTADNAVEIAEDAKTQAESAKDAAADAHGKAELAENAAAAPTYKIVDNGSPISQDPSGAWMSSTLSCRRYQTTASIDGTTSDEYYAGRMTIDASADGTTWANVHTAVSNSSLVTKAMSSIVSSIEGCAYVRVTLYAAGGTTEQLAQAMLSIVQATGNHLVETSARLFVVETGSDPQSGGALRLANDRVEMLKDGNVLMRLAANLMEIGINATSAIIKFCGGKATIRYDAASGYTVYESEGPVALLANSGSCMIGVSSTGGPAGDYGMGMSGTRAVINGSDLAVNGNRATFDQGIIHGNYTEGTAVWYEVRAGLVVVTMKLYDVPAGAWYALADMPAAFRPKRNTTGGLIGRYHNNVGVFEVKADGTVQYNVIVTGPCVGQLMYSLE